MYKTRRTEVASLGSCMYTGSKAFICEYYSIYDIYTHIIVYSIQKYVCSRLTKFTTMLLYTNRKYHGTYVSL